MDIFQANNVVKEFVGHVALSSEEQVKKIENALHYAGNELQAAQLV
jgi:hypothetical protein